MSGLGRAPDDYAAAVPDAAIGDGLAIQGEKVNNAATRLERWITVTAQI